MVKNKKHTKFKKIGFCALRGGSWSNNLSDFFLTHYRRRVNPGNNLRGFRCILPLNKGKGLIRIK